MNTARLKYLVEYQKGKVPKTFSDDASLYPYLSMEYLRCKKGNVQYVEDNGKYLLVEENEVLVLWDGANAGEVMLSKKGYISSTMAIIKPDKKIFHKGFFYYFLKEKEQFFKDMANRTTIPHLNQDAFFNKHYHILPYHLQLTINNYLDSQVKKIKTFITKKQTFIKLLKEQRQAIINVMVSGKLLIINGKTQKPTKTKDSGIDWLGDIPEHWDILRIKNIFAEIDERSETGKEELLSVSHYKGITKKRDSLTNEDDFISNAKTLVGYKKVAEDDLVSNIMLAWNGSLGISKHDGITSPAYCVYRIKDDNNPNYFGYLFTTVFMKAEFRKKSFGIIDSRLRLYSDKFFSIPAFVPPKKEQSQIITHIKTETSKIDQAISKSEKEIELIQEYQKAMIAEAVLGKI